MEFKFSSTLPYSEIVREAPILKEKDLDIEVEIQDSNWLLTTCEMSSVRRVGEFLSEREIGVTVNGPIFDLNPGSFDDFIREHTKNVFLRTIELSYSIGSPRVILTSGFSPFLDGEALIGWRNLAIEVWKSCLDKATDHNVSICIENRYETVPDILTDLVSEMNNEMFGVCLDTGHVNVYSRKNLLHWVKELKEITMEIHLNDNNGKTDGHLALGEGTLDVLPLFRALRKHGTWPPMVFEMGIQQIEQSFKHLESSGAFAYQPKLL